MELHRNMAAMKEKISNLQKENANKVKGVGVVAAVNVSASDADAVFDGFLVSADLKKRLDLSQKKLKDTTQLFQETDSKYSELGLKICPPLILPLSFIVVEITLLLCLY